MKPQLKLVNTQVATNTQPSVIEIQKGLRIKKERTKQLLASLHCNKR